MKLKEIIKRWEKVYPTDCAFEWDNVGLLLGDNNYNINKILCCLDVNEDVVKYAIDNNIDCIFSHHPVIFTSLKRINNMNFNSKKILKLLENKIAVYSAHTNLDMLENGLNDYVLFKLNFKGNIISNKELDAIRYIKLDEKKSLYEIMSNLYDKLDLPYIRYVKVDEDIHKKNIQKIALVTGSGSSYISEVISKNMHLLITSDLKHHESLDAKERNLNLIDIEHFGSEKLVANLIYEVLKTIVSNEVQIEIFNMKETFKLFNKETNQNEQK